MENDQNHLDQTTVDRNIRKNSEFQKQSYDDYLAQTRYQTGQNAAFGQENSYGSNGAAQNTRISQENSYGSNGYGQNTGFSQENPYGLNGFGQNTGFSQENSYGSNGVAQNTGFNQNNNFQQGVSFNQDNGFLQNNIYGQTGNYNQNNGYNQNMYGGPSGFQNQSFGNATYPNNFANGQYGNDPGIPNVTPFQEPPKKNKKVTAIIIIVVALLAVGAVILAFVMGSKDDEKDKKESVSVNETVESESETETVYETETGEETEIAQEISEDELITPYDYYMENDTITVDGFLESCYGGDVDAFKADCVEHDQQTLLNKGYNYIGDPVKYTGVVSYTDSEEGIYYISKTGRISDEILFIDDSVELDPVHRGDYVTFYGIYVTNIDDTEDVQVPGCFLIAIDELNYCEDQKLEALTYTYTDEESVYAETMSNNITYSIFEDEDYASLEFFFSTEQCGNFCILVQTRYYDKDKNLIFVSSDTSEFFSDQKKSMALIDLPHRRGDYYDLIDYDSYEYDMYIYEVPSYANRSVDEITYEITDKNGSFELKLTNNTDEERALTACIVTYDADGKVVETFVVYIDEFTGTTTKTAKMNSSDYAGYEFIYYYIF